MYLYYKIMKTTLILVGVYVDDLLVTSNDAKMVNEFFEQMKTFDVKDLGIALKFLGIKIEHETPNSYSISQRTMLLNLIEQFGLKNAKLMGTPIADVILSAENMNLLSAQYTSLFRTMAGALLWIARCTRPDIAFAVHQMTRRTHAPRICDLKIVRRLLRYLDGTSEYRLDISKMNEDTNIRFEVYTDADWASESTDRKSINGALMYLNGMLVPWYRNKQALVSLSYMESEFISAARGEQESMGFYCLVKELGMDIQLPMKSPSK
jgi:hypothetical protein